MSYCTVADVEALLGTNFTPDEEDRCAQLIAAAQDWIDTFCHRTFEATTPITGERHRLEGPRVYLRVVPLASVDAVHQAPWYVGSTPHVLEASSDYQLVSSTTGEIRVAGYRWGDLLVDYTPNVTPPPVIVEATLQLVAARMANEGAAAPGSSQASSLPPDVKRARVGGEWEVERFTAEEVSAEVLGRLSSLRLYQRTVIA